MTDRINESDLGDIFASLDTAVLEQIELAQFRLLTPAPEWWGYLYPLASEPLDLVEHHSFIANFLIDAQAFWDGDEPGRLRSGIWSEIDAEACECHLEATAICVGARQLLLIELLSINGDNRQTLIQKARESQLDSLQKSKEQRQVEVLLRQRRDELEQRVAERTEQLQREITERQRIELQLRESLGEKEAMLREIHHRVKNNLQIINSLLGLQAQQLEDEYTQTVLHTAIHRVNSMALAHETLYESNNLARIDIGDYFATLALHLQVDHAHRSIDFAYDIEQAELDIDTAVPLGLIVTELVSNCLLHAFPGERSGSICIGFTAGQDGWMLSIRDDGCGMPAELDFANPRSLGLKISHALSKQVSGKLTCEQSHGTTITLSFP